MARIVDSSKQHRFNRGILECCPRGLGAEFLGSRQHSSYFSINQEKRERIGMTQINVTINDYYRLMSLLEFSMLMGKMPDIQSRLYDRLVAGKTFTQDDIDVNIVTMNSRVRLKDLQNQRETEITLTYPKDALPRERRISIFSEIGIALLGRMEKDVVSWKVPDGVGLFEIAEIVYQPEAAGDYHL